MVQCVRLVQICCVCPTGASLLPVQWEFTEHRPAALSRLSEPSPRIDGSMQCVHSMCVCICVNMCVSMYVCACTRREEAHNREDRKKVQNSAFKEDVLIEECPHQRILIQN